MLLRLWVYFPSLAAGCVSRGAGQTDTRCADGNAETDNHDDGAGTMEALYFGSAKGGLNHGGAGAGPWIMADMENALWGADKCVPLSRCLIAQAYA